MMPSNAPSVRYLESWEPSWIVSHASLRRRRKLLDQIEAHFELWVATMLLTTLLGDRNPTTAAVRHFDVWYGPKTLPLGCQHLAAAGPVVTGEVLARIAWPELAWRRNAYLDERRDVYLRWGVPAFRKQPDWFAFVAAKQLGISQWVARACCR